MAKVLHGDASNNQLNAAENRTQVYGLAGNDTLTSGNKSNVLLVGGDGDDSLIMSGGTGTLSGGAGKDTFELTYSATKKLSAVIEDLEPSEDKIIVNFDGNTAPQLTTVTSGNDIILRDGELLNVTLKSVRDNDYLNSNVSNEAWKVLELTNAERENRNLDALTASDGLTKAAEIRAVEITKQGNLGILEDHTRLNGTPYYTVFSNVGKYYFTYGENLDGGAATPQEVVYDWINSDSHRENILNSNFKKLGVGYNYDDPDPFNHRWYWTQLFADSLTTAQTVSTDQLLTANPAVDTVSKFITLTENPDTYSNSEYGATIDAKGGGDSITSTGLIVSINGGNDSDTINNFGSFTTINAGNGNDSINLAAQEVLIQYALGDGFDTISGLNATDTVTISGDEFTPATVGNDLVVAVGNDSITLTGAARSGVQILGERSNLFILTDDNDNFVNTTDNTTIQALGGNDTVENTGAQVSIDGGDGSDTIRNNFLGNYVTIDGDAGNDFIDNSGDYVSISGGKGADTIRNNYGGDSVTIDGGDGNDYISGDGNSITLNGGSGSDSIDNYATNVLIDGGADNDSIGNVLGNYITITGGADNDSINNYDGSKVSINGGSGNDYIYNSNTCSDVTITGGSGSDSISNYGSNTTISGGLDNDTIKLDYISANNLIQYSEGDGNDTITGLKETDTLKIGDGTGTYSSRIIGSDIILTVGDGQIILRNAATLSAVHIQGSLNGDIYGSNGADSIQSTVSGIMVHALGGNDSIYNGDIYYNGQSVTIDAGSGNDTIQSNSFVKNVSINGGAGNDTIRNFSDQSTIEGGDGDDRIFPAETYGKIDSVTVSGGKGNDTIVIGSVQETNSLIRYAAGDGNDLITGFNENSTLSISGGYSTQVSGKDLIVTVGDGQITLQNLLTTANVLQINNRAISLADIKLLTLSDGDDSITNLRDDVTIDAGAGNDSIINYLDVSRVSINGNAGRDYLRNRGGSEVTLAGGSESDSIENWGDSVTIDAGSGSDSIDNYATNVSISGGAGTDTIYSRANKVTINGGSGNDSINNFNAHYSLGSSVGDEVLFVYKAGDGNDFIEGFNETSTLSIEGDTYSTTESNNDFIVTVGEGKITLSNAARISTININDSVFAGSGGTKIIIGTSGKDSIFNRSEGVTVDADAGDDYISNEYTASTSLDGASISGSDGSDTISNKASYATLDGGDGNDSITNNKNNVTIDGGAGSDTIYGNSNNTSINGGSGSDSIYSYGHYVTIGGGAGDDTIYGDSDNTSINGGSGSDSIYNNSFYVTIGGGADSDTISNHGLFATINAGAGDDYISNEYRTSYSISGGNSVLFVYEAGDGNDVIKNFTTTDTLSISGGEYTYSTVGNDIVFTVGEGSIKLLDAATLSAVNVQGTWSKRLTLTEGDDIYRIDTDGVTVEGKGGNDDITNGISVLKEDGTGYNIVGFSGISIDGGEGDDEIDNYGSNVTVIGSAGNDTLSNSGSIVTMDGGDGNDTLSNSGSIVTINGGAGDDSINNFLGKNVTIDGGSGSDSVTNWGAKTSISGGAGNDTIYNSGSEVTISSGEGNDSIENNDNNVTIDGGAGNDYITNWGANISILGGEGSDLIMTEFSSSSTILGGAGDDRISLSSTSENNFIQYDIGDGNDTIWNFGTNDTLNISADSSLVSSVVSGDDVIIRVGSGSIRLVDARDKPSHVIIGESGTEGGGSGGGDSGGSSSGDGGGRGGNDGGNVSGGTSSNEGMNSDASGNKSAVGSRGRGTSTSSNTSGGNVRVASRNSRINLTAPVEHVEFPNILTPSAQQTTANQRIYSGGNQVISDYTSGEKIIFGEVYTGSFYDAAGNSFLKAYSATTAGIIDGRGLAGFEIINGSAGSDAIFAGDGGSQLWGGADFVKDIMVGGGGTDVFIGGRTQGADVILNASSADIVHLNDANLSDIIATEENNGAIAVAFNTGNVVGVQSSEALSATFMLAEGSAYRYNHSTRNWQSA